MNRDRRKFINTAGVFTAGAFILPQLACKQGTTTAESMVADSVTEMVSGDLQNYGLQLYTLRDDLPKDPKGILKQVADFGYQTIESYEGDKGMFWGMTHKEFKTYMDELGLRIVSSHTDMNKDFEKKAMEAAEIGMETLICPWVGPQKKMDDWKKIVDRFNECGEICKKNGIKFAYHNHAYSFEPLDGIVPQDYIMENTDSNNIDMEMDIYWVVTAGVDPEAYMKKYSGRFTSCHVKDRIIGAPLSEHEASCDLGKGSINFSQILKTASENGMKNYILEQERYDNTTPLGAAKVGAEYLKSLKFA